MNFSEEQKQATLDTILGKGYRASAKIGTWRRIVSDAISGFDESTEDVFTDEQWEFFYKVSQIINTIIEMKI